MAAILCKKIYLLSPLLFLNISFETSFCYFALTNCLLILLLKTLNTEFAVLFNAKVSKLCRCARFSMLAKTRVFENVFVEVNIFKAIIFLPFASKITCRSFYFRDQFFHSTHFITFVLQNNAKIFLLSSSKR